MGLSKIALQIFRSILKAIQAEGIVSEHFQLIRDNKAIKEVAKKIVAIIIEAAYNLQDGECIQYVNYNSSIDESLLINGFNEIDPYINSKNFPNGVKGKEEQIMKLAGGLAKTLADFKAEPGYRLATHEEMVAYYNDHFQFQSDEPFIFVTLGSVCYDKQEGVRVLVFAGGNGKTEAYTMLYGCPWREQYRTLLVRV